MIFTRLPLLQPSARRLRPVLQKTWFISLMLLLLSAIGLSERAKASTPEYRIPCNVSSTGNWKTVRIKKGLETDQQLVDDINTNGKTAHPGEIAIDFNNNTANIGARTYGVCNDLTIVSARGGTVTFNDYCNGTNGCSGGGWMVIIDHGDGQYSQYAHMAAKSSLAKQWYPEGTKVGTIGCTGSCTGTHLHFEVTNRSQASLNDWHFKNPFSETAYKGEYAAQRYHGIMQVGTTQTVQVSLKNIGTATWDDNTKIAPIPRETASPFYDPATWQSSTRIASAGSVAPGQTKVFQFALRAPTTPGTYKIPFGFVQESATWFNEPGDGAIWFEINVVPSYKGEYAGQRYHAKMEVGSTQKVQVHLKNIGTATWDNNTRIAPTPRDIASPFYDPATWLSDSRIMAAGAVAPGETKVFDFVLRAPTTPGQYRVGFGFLQEYVTWFIEPSDGNIYFDITVTHAVGEGSSRQQLFKDAYNRSGGAMQLGYPASAAHWSGTETDAARAVIQAFDKDAFILHDEPRDVPMNSVPAYVLRGPILRHFQSLDGSRSWLGPAPTSDQFRNRSGEQQSSFPKGYITWDGTTARATAWPTTPDGQWRAEYHNGFNLDAGPTWVQNEAAINHNWGTASPGNGAQGVWADDFGVRWTGRFNFQGGDYTFVANGDDTIRVWVDGNLVINTALAEVRVNRFMTPGLHDIKVEYIEVKGSATISFGWQLAELASCTITTNSQAVYTGQRTVELKANIPNAAYVQMSNDGGFRGATWQPYQPSIDWTLNDPGSRIATLVIYARFRDASGNPLCGGTLIDDIIYDPLAPTTSATITSVAAPTGASSAQQASSTIVTLSITASDQDGGSGVAEMQVSTDSSFAGAHWQPYSMSYQLTAQADDKVYVRVRDSVGNT